MKKPTKPKPEVSGGTGVIVDIGPEGASVSINGRILPVFNFLLPVGAKVGDSVICRFQLVKRQDDKSNTP